MGIDLDFTSLKGVDFEGGELPVPRCSNREDAGNWEETRYMSSKGTSDSQA